MYLYDLHVYFNRGICRVTVCRLKHQKSFLQIRVLQLHVNYFEIIFKYTYLDIYRLPFSYSAFFISFALCLDPNISRDNPFNLILTTRSRIQSPDDKASVLSAGPLSRRTRIRMFRRAHVTRCSDLSKSRLIIGDY